MSAQLVVYSWILMCSKAFSKEINLWVYLYSLAAERIIQANTGNQSLNQSTYQSISQFIGKKINK